MTKFRAEFPKFMQNLETRKYIAKHWISIDSKTMEIWIFYNLHSFTAGEWSVKSAV